MATLQFPKNLCDQLDLMVRRFWWNPKIESGHFWTPIAWSTLYISQKEGGLCFRNFWNFNQAILSKIAWWILSCMSCLCVNVLKASPIWKNLLGVKHLISKAACILVGNGNSIRIWEDP